MGTFIKILLQSYKMKKEVKGILRMDDRHQNYLVRFVWFERMNLAHIGLCVWHLDGKIDRSVSNKKD
jgi:hypothetical protein